MREQLVQSLAGLADVVRVELETTVAWNFMMPRTLAPVRRQIRAYLERFENGAGRARRGARPAPGAAGSTYS
jgi:hypothetical protein